MGLRLMYIVQSLRQSSRSAMIVAFYDLFMKDFGDIRIETRKEAPPDTELDLQTNS